MLSSLPLPTIERLFVYHKVLGNLLNEGQNTIFSYDLARMAKNTSAQVRRDLMSSGCIGSSGKGYDVANTMEQLSKVLDRGTPRKAIVVGLGNIGKALISYFADPKNEFQLVGAFDKDTRKTGNILNGCPCFDIKKLELFLSETPVQIAVLAVPAEVAQVVTDRLVMSGVMGILNFAPTRLAVPSWVFVEDNHITLMLKKIAFFCRELNAQLVQKND